MISSRCELCGLTSRVHTVKSNRYRDWKSEIEIGDLGSLEPLNHLGSHSTGRSAVGLPWIAL